MKSIKPGRGPSMMGAVGSLLAAVFGVIWIVAAVSMGAPFFFPLFGVVFVVLGVVQALYQFKNATGEHRYSSFDIVDSREEPDPLQKRFSAPEPRQMPEASASSFCPYCGTPLESAFEFCPRCGKKIPPLR